MEDNKIMTSENRDLMGDITVKDILVQLSELQKQLTENSQTSLHRLSDIIDSLGEDASDAGYEQISEICAVFQTRETTLQMLLELYKKMYEDIQEEDAARKCIALRKEMASKQA